MKRLILLYCLSFALCVGIRAQFPDEDYRPFIEEGKRWEVDFYKAGGDPENNYITILQTELFYFDGDTVIAGRTCKKMMCDTEKKGQHIITYEMGVYEEDKRVLYFAPGETETRLLYAFGEEPGTMIRVGMPRKDINGDYLYENCLITSYQDVTYNDIRVPCVCYVPEVEIDNPVYWFHRSLWIIGVGSTKGPIFNCRNRIMNRRVKCFVNDECLFDWSNFGKIAETLLIEELNAMGAYDIPPNYDTIHGIHAPSENMNGSSSKGLWYDLSGRRLIATPTRCGVYIHDGKKVVVLSAMK